ncbi:protein-tyrosine kinase [Chondrocystis sp. NIES-4102]|nr:protein-tyrosine kinase [Chondrocystis sp. NIES-4102]
MPDRSSDHFTYLPFKTKNGNGINRNGNENYVYSLPGINQPNKEANEDNLDLRLLTSVIKHRIRLISTITLGLTAATAIFTFLQKPKYQGSFQLLVEPVAEEQESPLALLQQDLNGLDYQTQVEVLSSPRVLNPVIAKLRQKYPEIEYQTLIKPKKSPLKIKQLDETKILEISYIDPDPEKIQFVLNNLNAAYLRYSLEEKRAKAKQGIDFVQSQLPDQRKQVDDLQSKVQKFRQQHNLLDPQQQAGILATQQVDFEQKLFDTQAKIKETKSLYTLLQQQLGLQPNQALAASYLSESPRYQNLLNELQQVEVELAKESTRFLPDNPIVKTLEEKREKLSTLLQQEAKGVLGGNLANTVDNTPNLTSPSSLRLELNQKYIEAANELEILQIREKALNVGLAQINQWTEQMPVIARQYTDLTRELKVATQTLTRFLTAQEELELQGAQNALPWQTIFEPKVLEQPISPNPVRNLALSLFSGLLLGISAALLAERLDPVYHSFEELKESVNLPILGIIPVQKDLQPLHQLQLQPKKEKMGLPQLKVGDVPLNFNNTSIVTSKIGSQRYIASPFLESFRSLNTNLKLLGSDNTSLSLIISSSIPSEGKSTIAANLAQAAAAMGQRVLLLDADLRRPQAHLWLGVENQQGLSNILATGLDVQDAIIQVPEWENLWVITAGDIPPDPTRLLSSQKMSRLMEYLRSSGKYDLIIYDTPPILGFADGRILSSHTDGIVLVVKIGQTDRGLVKENIDNIKMSNIPILGIVANHANSNANSNHYYSHYYAERK